MRRILLAILLLFPLSAHAVPGALFPPNNDYEKTLKHYTKNGSYYSLQDLHAQVIWYATYASDEFQRAFQGEYLRIYPQGQEGRAQTKASTWTTPSSDASFFVALYARRREMADLSTPKSLQDVSLEVGGNFIKPTLIEKIPITEFEIKFFNYVNLWYSAYRVVFPTTALRNRDVPFKLHLNGVAGASTLNFK
jgi:hypothetical protein